MSVSTIFNVSAAAGVIAELATPQLTSATATNISVGGTPANCSITVHRNGDYTSTGASPFDRTNEWLLSGDKGTAVGDDYEAFLSGSGNTPSGPALDEWHTISSDLVWVLQGSSTLTFTGTLQIRQRTDTTNNDSASFSLQISAI